MKHLGMIFVTVFISGVLLSSCCIGGYWMNGDPFPGPVQPYRDYWSKPAMRDEGRKADWVACGGSENGNFSWDSRRMLPGETNETSRLRQSSELKACLTPRGYHHEIARD